MIRRRGGRESGGAATGWPEGGGRCATGRNGTVKSQMASRCEGDGGDEEDRTQRSERREEGGVGETNKFAFRFRGRGRTPVRINKK